MKIHNIRLGLATNSSSSHSLILLDRPAGDNTNGQEFGWDFFTAGSRESKAGYLGQIVAVNLRSLGVHQENVRKIVEAVTGTEYDPDGYVDHQSVWDLPRSWDGKSLDERFLIGLKDFLLRDDLAILGGNDNTDSVHSLGEGFQLPIDRDYRRHTVCRYDEQYDYWTIFNSETGAKVRMTFGGLKTKADRVGAALSSTGVDVSPSKATWPELVDIKITDFCPYDCSYCYQDSTSAGQHCDPQLIHQLADSFKEWRVFEVAIGGGEPTLHPLFLQILKAFRGVGVVPNFTTKNLAWLRNDKKQREEILSYAGAFAYSADTADDVLALSRALGGADRRRAKVQHIVGSVDQADFNKLVKVCKDEALGLMLLGYKTTGRGDKVTPRKVDWIKSVMANKLYAVGIDTALAEQSLPQLEAAKVPSYYYHIKEGKFSMYVDAVAKKMGPSSYCDALRMRPIGDDVGASILEAFARW